MAEESNLFIMAECLEKIMEAVENLERLIELLQEYQDDLEEALEKLRRSSEVGGSQIEAEYRSTDNIRECERNEDRRYNS
ncbi:hypothetical protein KIN20_016382 [Parelaphostrongylus tenuis]|uniref:Uncharacterized protein n=1 Tax=Parelaphostrongylus tenuis TaxID=148309 RepID=A0AAD5MJY0_PARTN|nr:hypothetical protein KIN20_016382 [Parelaphostrongylus tenuis]